MRVFFWDCGNIFLKNATESQKQEVLALFDYCAWQRSH